MQNAVLLRRLHKDNINHTAQNLNLNRHANKKYIKYFRAKSYYNGLKVSVEAYNFKSYSNNKTAGVEQEINSNLETNY